MQSKKAPSSNKIINKITSLFNQILALIPNANIYTQHLIFLIGNLRVEKELINSLKQEQNLKGESIPILNTIREACEDFHLLLILLQKSIWPKISLSLNIEKPFKEINEFQDIIITQLRLLGIDIDSYGLNKEISTIIDQKNVEIDLGALYTYYHQPSNYGFLNDDQYKKLDKQRKRISALYDHYSIKKLDYIRREVKNPIKCSKNWKFDISKLPSTEPLTEKFYSNKWSINTYKVNNNTALVKLSIPLDKDTSDKKQKRLIKRRFMLLSALESNLLLNFVGGTIDHEANYIFQIGIDPEIFKDHFPSFLECLYDKYSSEFDIGRTSPTKIAFYIALSMSYLHKHFIVHGNLTTSSIFCINEKENTPIWNFRLSTGIGSILRRSPPEYLNDGVYTFASDVYQYGLLLYQIGTGKAPFYDINDKDIKAVICNPDKRPKLDGENGVEYFSPGMKKLIMDCWNQDPSKRPTFEEIIYRFQTEDIYMKNPNLDNLKQFLFLERSKKYDCLKYSEGLEKFNELLNENAKLGDKKAYEIMNGKEISKFIFRLFKVDSNKENLINYIKHLDSFGFFERIIPFFEIPDEKFRDEFVHNYIQIFGLEVNPHVFDLKVFTRKFLQDNGDRIICEYINSSDLNRELGLLLIDSIKNHLTDDMEKSLSIIIPSLIKAKRVDKVCTIVKSINPKIGSKLLSQNMKEISPLFNDKDAAKDSSFLIEFYIENTDEIKEIGNISMKDVMKSGNFDLLHQLMKSTYFLSSITSEDCKEIIITLTSDTSEQEQKRCALLACIGLDNEFYEAISQYNEIISKIINNDDQELVSRFIARLTRYSSPCNYILSQLEANRGEFNTMKDMRHDFYLAAMSRISKFDSKRVCKLPFFKENLIRNLNDHIGIEGTLRILGVLCYEKVLWQDCKLANCFINLLTEKVIEPTETKLLLSIISNIVLIDEVKELFSQNSNINLILFIIETEGINSGLGIRILSRLKLPAIDYENIEQLKRIAYCTRRQLTIGDKFGIEGSAQVINNFFSNNEEDLRSDIKDIINGDELYRLVIEASKKETNAEIFTKLMESIYFIKEGKQLELIPLFANIIMNTRGQLPPRFYELKSILT